MNRTLRVLHVTMIASLALAGDASASERDAATGKLPTADATDIVWWSCTATAVSPNGNPIQGPFECYLSDAFSTGNVILDKEGAFKTFVATRYGVNVVNQGCPVAAHKSSAEAALKINLANCNGRSWKVIESGWKFEPPG